MDDLTQELHEENEDKIHLLKQKARSTPFSSIASAEPERTDRITAVFGLHYEQVGESAVDYGFRNTITLTTTGVQAEEKRGRRVKKGSLLTIPATLEDGTLRGNIKIENRTGRNPQRNPTPEEKEHFANQVVLVLDADGKQIGIVRPGSFYFGEPPAGELHLDCVGEEAIVTYVLFPGVQ